MKIGFIGLGKVGQKLAANLLQSGFSLVVRDVDCAIAKPLFEEAKSRYGARAWSPNIVARLEQTYSERLWAPGFPSEIVDHEPGSDGYEVVVNRSL